MYDRDVLGALFGGTLAGQLYDPVSWIVMAVGLALGVLRANRWVTLSTMVTAVLIRLFLSRQADPLLMGLAVLAMLLLFVGPWLLGLFVSVYTRRA